MGKAEDRLVWEAPLKDQQAYLIQRFGTNVGLGNIPPDEILALEALRCRLRFDTLNTVTEEMLLLRSLEPRAGGAQPRRARSRRRACQKISGKTPC